jgi:hypothetical protein
MQQMANLAIPPEMIDRQTKYIQSLRKQAMDLQDQYTAIATKAMGGYVDPLARKGGGGAPPPPQGMDQLDKSIEEKFNRMEAAPGSAPAVGGPK